MDIVSLLFYPSWLNAVRDEGLGRASDPDRKPAGPHRAALDGPDWRLAFAPMALVAALVLAGVLFPTGV